jgi:hypothetical protein
MVSISLSEANGDVRTPGRSLLSQEPRLIGRTRSVREPMGSSTFRRPIVVCPAFRINEFRRRS